MRSAYLPLYRRAQQHGDHGARSVHVQDRRGSDFLPPPAWAVGGGCGVDDRERFLQRSLQGAADGVGGGSHSAARHQSRGERWVMAGNVKREAGNLLLEVKGLRVAVAGNEILKGVDLTMREGEVHAIMGPNGSGKSTLAQVLAGHPAYSVTAGTVQFDGQDLLELQPEERAQAGLFLAFQYPVEITGVTNAYFLRAAYNAIRKARGQEELDPIDFLDVLEQKLQLVGWGPEIMQRAVNSGFSGGEKKRNEILQMAVLEPKLAILDE